MKETDFKPKHTRLNHKGPVSQAADFGLKKKLIFCNDSFQTVDFAECQQHHDPVAGVIRS